MSRLKPILFFVLVAALAAFIVTRRPAAKSLNVGDPAPDFVTRDESGKEVRLSDLRGNVVFLNFWGTWCLPCRAEMPDMEKVNNRFKDRNFKMMAVATDTDWEAVKKFYAEHNLTLPAYLDPGRQVSEKYYVSKYPETYLIDGRGVVVKHYINLQPWTSPNMIEYFEELIEKEETAKASFP
jgi:peroxiredoxin